MALSLTVSILEDALSVCTELGQTFVVYPVTRL